MFKPITTAPALSQAITSTYLYDVVIAIVFVAIMVLVANLIQWRPGKNETSGKTRRVWFFVLMFVNLIGCLVFDFLAWLSYITVPAFSSKYKLAMIVASIVSTVVYFGLGFVLVKIAPIGSKLQSIFPKKDK